MTVSEQLDNLIAEVAMHCRVSVAEIHSRSRLREIVMARSVYFHIAVEKLKKTTTATAKHVGKNHATAIHSCKMFYYYRLQKLLSQEVCDFADDYSVNSKAVQINELMRLYSRVSALNISEASLQEIQQVIGKKIDRLRQEMVGEALL